jgi:(p)ppGpp synthase/HD superfamily hydrolase
VVEDTDITIEEIEKNVYPKIAQLVEGLNSLVKKEMNVLQAENFRKAVTKP